MARPRKKINEKLPPYVYPNNGRYEYRPHLGGGKLGRGVRLCSAQATLTEIWSAYDKVKNGVTVRTLEWLFTEYLRSPRFLSLKPRTQKDYQGYRAHIISQKTKSNRAFGDVSLEAITTPVLRRYMDRAKEKRGPVSANRHYAFMQAAFKWGVEYGKVKSSPCSGIKKFPEKARVRYVTNAEYGLCYRAAPVSLKIFMELAYLCRLRAIEAVSLREDDCLVAGLRIDRVKGSRKQIIAWSPRLRAAVDKALARPKSPSAVALIRNRRGDAYTVSGIGSNWQKVIRPLFENGRLLERYTLHDLKAKGVSDFEGDKFKASGHKTRAMVAVYDRKLEVIEPTH